MQTGLGVRTGSLKVETEIHWTQFDVLKTDTIPLPTNGNNGFLSFCDTTIQLTSELPDRDSKYSIATLEVPLMLRYSILPGKLTIGLGAKMNVPLRIVRRQRGFFFDRQTDDTGFSTCTTGLRDFKDTSGNGFRDFNLSISADAEYWVDRIGFSIGIDKRLTNLFVEPEYQPSYMHFFDTKPFFLLGKIMVKL